MICSPVAYLGQPIDFVRDHNDDTARRILHRLVADGFTVFSPRGCWHVPVDAVMSPAIQKINLLALDNSDLAVFYYPEDVPSVGIPVEIMHAVKLRKPVALVRGIGSKPAMSRSAVLTWLTLEHGVQIFGTDELLEMSESLTRKFAAWLT